MARVKDGRQPDARSERHHHERVHLVVDHLTGRSVIDRVDRLVVAVVLVAVPVGRLASVAGIVEEEGVVRLGAGDEPTHRLRDVGSRRLLTGVAGVVRQDDNVLLAVPVPARDEAFDVVNVVDAACPRVGGGDGNGVVKSESATSAILFNGPGGRSDLPRSSALVPA